MTTAEEIESAVVSLVATLQDRCPNLSPAVFLNGTTPKSIEDLCTTNEQKNQVKSWLSRQIEPSFSFVTEVNYNERKIRIINIKPINSVDAKLTCLEEMLRMIVLGSEDELLVCLTRFLEINGYCGSIPDERHIFNEIYDIAYSIKALLR